MFLSIQIKNHLYYIPFFEGCSVRFLQKRSFGLGILVCDLESSEGHSEVVISSVWYSWGLTYIGFLIIVECVLKDGAWIMVCHNGMSRSRIQIVLLFESTTLLPLTWVKILGVTGWRSGPTSQVSTSVIRRWHSVSDTLFLVCSGGNSQISPGHWVLSVCCQGSRDLDFSAGRSQRNRWLTSDWLAGIKVSEHQPATSWRIPG